LVAFAECLQIFDAHLRRTGSEKPNHRHRRLLCVRRERPRRRRTADERDQFAAFHSITSSARASSKGGTTRPSARAVLRLIASTIFVGNSTGRSPGGVSCRILSTKLAVR